MSKIAIFSIFALTVLTSLCRCDDPFVECTFEDNDCGIKNDEVMTSLFTYGKANIGGRNQNMLYLDISRTESNSARLVTPYYHSYGYVYGCLTIDWFSNGADDQSLSITQQDTRTIKVWSSTSMSNRWQRSTVNIDLRNGDPRFFIEAIYTDQTNGAIAIDDLRLDYHSC